MRTQLYCLCLLFACAGLLEAQTATGRLTGSVIDPDGLTVVDAKITVKGETTGVSLTGSTNAQGAFSFTDVPPGEYSIEVSAANFRRQLIRRFKVDVAKENVLPPVRLELGPVTETVEVKAEVGQVQTTNAELAATVTMQQIQHLPLADRNPLSLISLQAGVASNGSFLGGAANGTVINGQRTSFSNVTLDGINIQDNYIRDNALDFLPNRLLVDEISEFTITTQNGNAALGLGSSQVNFVTPSGTNSYHGSVYYFNRNSALAANQWFNNKDAVAKPRLNLHQFGGTMGGPIVHNKLLFYSNYEGYRQRHETTDVTTNTTILTATARAGLFTYRDNQNRVQRVNILSAAGVKLDPRLAQLLQNVPGPENINNFRSGDSDSSLLRNTAGYSFNVRDNTDRDNVTSRLDYIRSERHLFSATYRYNRELVDRSDIENAFHTVPVVQNDGHVHFLSVAWRWNPRPSWTNELRGGMNIAPGSFTSSEKVGDQLFEGFVFTNPVVNSRPQGRDTNTFNYMDNATWQRGRHSIKFGAQFQRLYVTTFDSDGLIPTYGIGFSAENDLFLDESQFPTRISSTDLDRANNLLATLGGIVGSASQFFNIKDRNSGFVANQEYRRRYRLHNYSFYGQDTWKLNRRLTVNFGMRWEYAGRFDERDGLLLSPIFTSIGVPATLRSNATLDFAGAAAGRPLYPKDLNNFGPNIGIAWDPFGDGKTAIRAGYTINYVNDQILLAAENATFNNHGLQAQLDDEDLVTTMSAKLPAFALPKFQVPRTAADNFDIDPTAALFAVDPKLRTPYVQQWTLGVQRQLTHNTVFEVRYAANKGTKLLRGFDYNQVIIRQNGFLDDFIKARNNGFLALARNGTFNPAFSAAVPGSQQLPVFAQLFQGGLLGNTTIRSLIRSGEPGELAAIYYVNDLAGKVSFTPNPNTFVADLITNYSNSSYNALQMEVRRRTTGGIEFQGNYTFSKVLTDSSGTQVRFDPFLDFGNGKIERSRANFDLTHVFNANFVVPLPLGSDHRIGYGPLDRVLSNWTLGSILGWQSGAPFSILSGRGTLNRRARSGRTNTAVTTLTKSQLDALVGFRMTGDGPFMIAPSAINPKDNSGAAADGEGQFNGQVFFHPGPGQLGTLQRRPFSGPSAFTLDLKIDKEIRLTESRLLRVEANFLNLFNHPAFFADNQSIGSTVFGRVSSTLVGARVVQVGMRYSF